MPKSKSDAEDTLEHAAIAVFGGLGWQTISAYHESYGPDGTLGRENRGEVVLRRELRTALRDLNPGLPAAALELAIDEITRDRSVLGMVQANQEIWHLLREGVVVTFSNDEGEQVSERVTIIGWRNGDIARNRFLLVSQLWIAGEMHTRRPGLLGFVNGIPLLFIELKAHYNSMKQAYNGNLKDYKDTIPALFWYNGLIMLSNGSQTCLGSVSASWEHFAEWKRINDEGEHGVISLDTAIRAACTPQRLLDLVENFTLFDQSRGGLVKLVAKNHQYLGVNNAVAAVGNLRENQGRLGVFWHTQGSGKSYSMVFFAQKVLRRVPGNWTFVLVTDRQELDQQLYKTFANVGAVTESEEQVHAESAEHLRRLLGENHRYIFTLIQKFRTEGGAAYPELSTRKDVIVITDEAHRSQYDIFAQNMRSALPNAAFMGFTGTPLMMGEEKTRDVFGDYISVYNFRQSIEDGATVPLYYENRIPQLQLTNQELNTDMERLLESAELDDAQERKLEREFAREYHLITRDDRLDTIADDVVTHFINRGVQGKAMLIAIDKATAVRMYDKVKAAWVRALDDLRQQLAQSAGGDQQSLSDRIAAMERTDMAVIISQSQGEIEEFRTKGLDITPHRKRMVTEDLETKFKDPNDPLRLVFVCAMWITGFDVPTCSTIYLDKPMRNHTLMQTIARANRVYPGKPSGLIVDYVGVFRNLQQALAIYGSATSGSGDDDTPVKDKAALIAQLREALDEARSFCLQRGCDLDAISAAPSHFARIALIDDAIELILVTDESKERFLELANDVDRLFKAILPDPLANEFGPLRATLTVMADKIRGMLPAADISDVMGEVNRLLDRSIAPGGYVITPPVPMSMHETAGTYVPSHLTDLSAIDFDYLRQVFEQGRKHTEVTKLRGALNQKLRQMVRLNRSRMNYVETFQAMIDEYNAGSKNIDALFAELITLTKALNAEEQRTIAENLSEEELALFDLLTKPMVTLTKDEEHAIKAIVRDLLVTLKRGQLVLDWRKKQQARAMVQVAIEEGLNALPAAYDNDLFQQKCQLVYQHVYENYYGGGQSIYQRAA